METEKYFVLNLKHKKDPTASTDKIYKHLEAVKHLNIPYIPLKDMSTSNTTLANKTETNLQIALPHNVDHSAIYKMISAVNDDIDVTLLGAQSKDSLRTDADPERFGLDHFILGEKYEGLGK